jgi:hypothetical protein
LFLLHHHSDWHRGYVNSVLFLLTKMFCLHMWYIMATFYTIRSITYHLWIS